MNKPIHPKWLLWWGSVNLVVATYKGGIEEFRTATERLVPYISSRKKRLCQNQGNWISLASRMYDRSGVLSIDARLLEFDCFCLRIEIQRGISWELSVFANKQKLFTYTHDFSLLHPKYFQEEHIKTLAKAYEGDFNAYVEDYEVILPPELLEKLSLLSFKEAHLQCLDWYRQTCITQADRLFSLFQQFEIACDRQKLADILTGKLSSVKEIEWYVGNLPRFLAAIGLSEVFWDWQKELNVN